jgi:hypothetical protein
MRADLDRSGDAAVRVLAARASGAEVELIHLELVAWVAGASGRQPPSLPDPREDLHVRQAALFGSGHDDAAFALLAEHLETADGDLLLFDACHLVGARWPDRLIELAEQHRDVRFNGELLARTRDPVRLLALVDADRQVEHTVSTIAELYIRGYDAGAVVPEIEARWAALNQRGKMPGYVSTFRDAELRLAARRDMEYAIVRLDALANAWGYDEQDAGTEAVLGRLVQTDPDRACQIVARRQDPENRVEWLDPLVRWHELPAAAEPFVDELLGLASLESVFALARVLIVGRAWPQLDRALANVAGDPAIAIARGMPTAVAGLRDAGLHDDAERAREKVLAVIGDRGEPGQVPARDLFEALSAPGRPPLVPWMPDPGMP